MPVADARLALQQVAPRFSLDNVEEYAQRYDYDEDEIDIEAIAAAVRPEARFEKAQFVDIARAPPAMMGECGDREHDF